MPRKLISFGFKHGTAVSGVGQIVIDIRTIFRNPHSVDALRSLTGQDPRVVEYVQSTPDFKAKYEYIKQQVTAPGVEIAYIGCTGGQHRSVAIVEMLGKDLSVPVEHHHMVKARP